MNPPPGAFPVPDWQGQYSICTCYSLAKAALSGFQKGKFSFGIPIDLNQDAVIAVLLIEFKDIGPRHPTDFNQKSYLFQDVNKTAWKTYFNIQSATISELQSPASAKFEYLVTYWESFQNLHCVLMNHYDPHSNTLFCINSQGGHRQFPSVPASDVVDLYQVECQAVRLWTPGQLSPLILTPVPSRSSSPAIYYQSILASSWLPGPRAIAMHFCISPQTLTPEYSPSPSPPIPSTHQFWPPLGH